MICFSSACDILQVKGRQGLVSPTKIFVVILVSRVANGFLNVEPKSFILADVDIATTFGWHFVSFLAHLHIHLLVAAEFVLHGLQNIHIYFDLTAHAIWSIEAFAPFGHNMVIPVLRAITVLLGINLLAIASERRAGFGVFAKGGWVGAAATESTVGLHLATTTNGQQDEV